MWIVHINKAVYHFFEKQGFGTSMQMITILWLSIALVMLIKMHYNGSLLNCLSTPQHLGISSWHKPLHKKMVEQVVIIKHISHFYTCPAFFFSKSVVFTLLYFFFVLCSAVFSFVYCNDMVLSTNYSTNSKSVNVNFVQSLAIKLPLRCVTYNLQ